MKQSMILFLFILICVGISADVYRLAPGQNRVELLSSDQQLTRISYTISNFEYTPVKIGTESYNVLQLGKEANTYEKGLPGLPQISRNIIIPNQARMSVQITESSYVDIPMAVAPSKGILTRNIDPATIPYSFSPFYQKAEQYPASGSSLSEPFIMRDFRGITVTASPFVYYPLTKMLRVYTHLVLDVKTDGNDTRNVLNRSTNEYSKYFEEIYQNLFMNFTTDRYTLVNDRGRMIVIAPNSYLTTVQPYVNWKIQKGISTTLVDFATIGTTAATLKTYIQGQYDLNNGLTFVVLCGDAAQIPSLSSGGGGSDPSFSLCAGSDNYPEIIIGRFSAETTAQLQTQVDRSIQYERDLTTSATWLQSATGIASNEGGGTQGDNGESDATHMDNIRTQLLGYGYSAVDQIYQGTGGSATDISAALNAGRGFVNYVGHGSDTSWASVTYTNTNVTALTNVNKLPFIMDVACVNGNFVSLTCFAEAWMRATSSGSPTGAVGIYASSINQSWNSPMLAEDEFTDLMTAGTKNTLGGLYYNSSCKMMESYGTDGQNMFLTWHIFGDPSLQVRSKTPSAMTVTYNTTIPIGTTSLAVSTGVNDAKVCLSYNNTILGTGYTDSSGNVTLALSGMPTSPTTLTMTVTAFNKVTHQGSVSLIVASGPYVNVDSYAYADTGNNTPESNESGYFNMTYKNVGTTAATSIVTTLTTTGTGITITDNTETIASLAAGASTTINHAYAITMANNIADQTAVPFHVAMVSGSNNWSYDFNTTINAPNLAFGSFSISDPLGNGNGQLDPGETVTITIPLNNNGHAASATGTATLSSPTTGITVTGSSYGFASIVASGSTTASFTVVVSSAVTVGTVVTFNFNATAGAYTATNSSVATVGIAQETFETGNLNAYAWTTAGSTPYWSVVNAGAHGGTYCAKSGAITHSQSTDLKVTMNITNAGTISFYKMVSSEASYDYLKFYIDATETGSWSGAETAYTQVSYAVTAGTHTFKWTYLKDTSLSSNSDCAWIDDIVFPPTSGSVYSFDPPQNLAAGTANGSVTLTWAAPATGTPASYKVYRDGTAVATGITALTYTNTGLTNGTTYSFYVTAVYTTPVNGESPASNTVSATPSLNSIVTIGTGTTTQTYPIDRYYNYSSFEAIYLQSEIAAAGTINSLGFYKSSGTDVNAIVSVTIYLKHTTATTLATGTYSTTGYTQVYSGSYPNTATSGWMEVALSPTFLYNNTDNLQILILKGNQTYLSSGYPLWNYTSTSTNYRTRMARSDTAQPTSLTYSYNRPNIRLTVAPQATPPSYANSATSLNFGTVTVGQNAVRSFTITNSGGSALIGNITTPTGYVVTQVIRSSNAAGKNILRNTLGYNIAAGSNATFNVTFTPTTGSTYTGSIGITSNDTNHPTNTVSVTGTGITQPQISISTNSISTVLYAGETDTDQITVNNLGGLALTYSVTAENAVRSSGVRPSHDLQRIVSWLSINPASGSISGSGNAQLTVTYDTDGLAAGTYHAVITITSNDPETPAKEIDVTLTVNVLPVPDEVVTQAQGSNMQMNWATVPDATMYNVYRATSPTGPYEKIATIPTTTFVDTDTSGNVYFYYVTAEKTSRNK